MALDLKNYAISQLEAVRDRYLQDLAALPDETLAASAGGASRAPTHFTYEIMCVNQRFVKRLRGEDPGAFDPGMWTNTPDEYITRSGAPEGFKNAMNDVIEAVRALPEEEMLREIQTPGGSTTPFDLALFCATHVNYHDGQLNYIQAINGDPDVHWRD